MKKIIEYGCWIIKPDANIRGISNEILNELKIICKDQKIKIVLVKKKTLNESDIKFIYSHIATKPFFKDFILLMKRSESILVFTKGEKGLNQTLKQIRGSRATILGDQSSGVRGKYCSIIMDITLDDIKKWEQGIHQDQRYMSEKLICNVIHSSDTEIEALKTLLVFTQFNEKFTLFLKNPDIVCKLLGTAWSIKK
ncbi:MAG: nucleoside-diphosphate kinase [Candidatus Pacebacteria bacterium]|nr:nucleoside-diphosphate kinase [Candidatus Paceibacterota bacterium]